MGFLITPQIVTVYKADVSDPWEYSWIGFNGPKVKSWLKEAGLSEEHPVFEHKEDDTIDLCFRKMNEARFAYRGGDVKRLTHLYLFLLTLTESNPNPVVPDEIPDKSIAYINEALRYIEMNYSLGLTVEEVARHLGLNRSYFTALFKKEYGMTLQEYIINFRIKKAQDFLTNPELSIDDIGRSVGYCDIYTFSKAFKKVTNMSPRDYRKTLQPSKNCFY
jgi:AraC-like DNA-binding protein